MRAAITAFMALFAAFMLSACLSTSPGTPETSMTTVTETSVSLAQQRVPEDLRERVASLMVVGAASYDDARAALEQGAGGLIIPSWADPRLLTEEGRNINALRAEFKRPFIVAIDFEGGRVQRHAQILGSFPSPRDLAKQPNDVIRATAFDIGSRLREYGINVDYAPLLDLDVTDLNIVGDRAFGPSPERVSEVATQFSQGLVDAKVAPTYKHFPGHGRASGDTHHTLAVTPHVDELNGLDLAPYAVVLPKFPTASVMVGHMAVPGLGPNDTPASLNPAIYELLRTGNYPGGSPFTGVAVTDDLSGMRAITDHMSTPEAVRRAIAAGADQALWSTGADLPAAIDGVVAAVHNGEIPEERITTAATRVQQQFIDTEF
ncbi:glycoside hydrolase family 3 N-terminal domain-containing protein [Corynebacterium meitnerae]|uniref:beta-N-acetylhexosaminidase n=1 Tax=Corynebacterium meitnerae TaxID=2913498 RepID=A0A9X3LXX9_9CORY|nr:glycoside hydrolase family 3 N-terminal domain-containing protein [Corynebacterium meitnerae]MCZ9294833.1 glycoside hydrolase family 3 protein [Corynebacterium meitnerae]